MALKAEEISLTFDLEEFTWGDLVDIRNGQLFDVCGRLGRIEGKTQDEVLDTLRQLSINEIGVIDRMLSEAMQARSNPTDDTEKN
jgi:hypothetical protein